MAIQVQIRRDTAANWTSNNPTLAQGEWGYETDTTKLKIGDGSTAWTSLGYHEGDHANLSNLDYASAGHTGFEPTLPLTTRGDILYRNASNTTARLGVGAANQVLTSDGTDISWEDPTGGGGTREEIVASGGSSAVNSAITTINSAGGGTVRLDGMIDMDGDITMLSNVKLRGYGPGTGLRNNTASAYAINFVGSTPTYYNIASPSTNAVTCDTVGEAANFSKGDFIIAKTQVTYTQVSSGIAIDDGNAGTGVVPTSESMVNIYHSASAQAAPISGAVEYAGIENMDLLNTSSGTLTVNIQYAHHIMLEKCVLDESQISIDESGYIRILNCQFKNTDDTSFAEYISLDDMITKLFIHACSFTGGDYSVKWTTADSAISTFYFTENFDTTRYGCYLKGTYTTRRCMLTESSISNNRFHNNIGPDGLAGSIALTVDALCFYCTFSDNIFYNSTANFLNANTLHYYGYCNIENNHFDYATYVYGMVSCVFANNTIQGGVCYLYYGPQYCVISNNRCSSHMYIYDNDARAVSENTICNNVIAGGLQCTGDSTRVLYRNKIVGNSIGSILYLVDDLTDNIIVGNTIGSNVTITNSASDTADRNVFALNNVNGSVTWTEDNQDYNVIIGNATNGSITDLTAGGGTGNIQADNTEY